MSVTFRPARRSEAKPLVGIYSESGAGKTFTALLLARGFAGPAGKIGMIETEGGRGEAYQGHPLIGDYTVASIRGDFSPQNYGDAISAAEREKLDVLIIDSASHEWEGAGGVLDMAAKNQAAGKKGVLVWQQPKIDHQRHFMLRLMQTPIPLVIVCMRAKYPMEQKAGSRDWTRSEKLDPKQADDILFEMFVHFWIDHEHKAHVTKYTVDSLRPVFRDGEPVTLETGARLAAWARGETAASDAKPQAKPSSSLEIQYIAGVTKPGEFVADFKERQARATSAEIETMWAPAGPNVRPLATLKDRAPQLYDQLVNARDDRLNDLAASEKDAAA